MTLATISSAPRPSLVGSWLLAARPKTLSAASVPVVVGTACAFELDGLRPGPALAALGGALLLQIGANFANDVYDYEKGADTAERLGPTRAVQAGLISPSAMKRGMFVVFGLALLLGVYLMTVAGPVILAIGVASMFLALAVGAVGNLLGSAITGLDPVWNVSVTEFGQIVLANVLGMLIGFTLGVLLRSSAAAIVGYFIYSLVLPAALGALAAFQEWFRDLQPWVDVNYAIGNLFSSSMSSEQWTQLGVTTLVWLWIPLALGLRAVLRAEVK
jgi:1,4-dihydroxy-2-naphthoate octaprenyltransferase